MSPSHQLSVCASPGTRQREQDAPLREEDFYAQGEDPSLQPEEKFPKNKLVMAGRQIRSLDTYATQR